MNIDKIFFLNSSSLLTSKPLDKYTSLLYILISKDGSREAKVMIPNVKTSARKKSENAEYSERDSFLVNDL